MRKGFTFIEIMIALAILGVFAAIILPVISHNEHAKTLLNYDTISGNIMPAMNDINTTTVSNNYVIGTILGISNDHSNAYLNLQDKVGNNISVLMPDDIKAQESTLLTMAKSNSLYTVKYKVVNILTSNSVSYETVNVNPACDQSYNPQTRDGTSMLTCKVFISIEG